MHSICAHAQPSIILPKCIWSYQTHSSTKRHRARVTRAMVSNRGNRHAAKCATSSFISLFACTIYLFTGPLAAVTHLHFPAAEPGRLAASPSAMAYDISVGSITHVSNCKYLAWLWIKNVTWYRIVGCSSIHRTHIVLSLVFHQIAHNDGLIHLVVCDWAGVPFSPHRAGSAFNGIPDLIRSKSQFVFVFRQEGVFALRLIWFSYFLKKAGRIEHSMKTCKNICWIQVSMVCAVFFLLFGWLDAVAHKTTMIPA